MNFETYEESAGKTAIYPDRGNTLIYPALKLAGESGEVAEKVGKMLRDDAGVLTDKRRDDLIKELGDVLWYVAALCHELKVPMAEVAQLNIDKLNSRKERNVLTGDGDDR